MKPKEAESYHAPLSPEPRNARRITKAFKNRRDVHNPQTLEASAPIKTITIGAQKITYMKAVKSQRVTAKPSRKGLRDFFNHLQVETICSLQC